MLSKHLKLLLSLFTAVLIIGAVYLTKVETVTNICFPEASATEVVLSGTCGAKVTYTLDKYGTLTISGEGNMNDYDPFLPIFGSRPPWYNNSSSIDRIVINQGVTHIGEYAFINCTQLTSIVIPDSVTSIGEYAFYNCSKLSSISIPESVTYYGNSIMFGCSSLESISVKLESFTLGYLFGTKSFANSTKTEQLNTEYYIPKNLKRVELLGNKVSKSALSFCNSINTVKFGKSIQNVYYDAFYYCNNVNCIEIDSIETWTNINFSSHLMLQKDAKLYVGGVETTEIIIPDTVTSIKSSAFYGLTMIESVIIPDSVTSIGDYAFFNCSSLQNISIPAGVTTIGESAFYGCSSLQNITIPDGVRTIGESTFSYCSSLQNITIPDSVTTIGQLAFYDCSSLQNISIPAGVKEIRTSAFSGCSSLQHITIPDSVTRIDSYAFSFCSSLQNITIPDGVTTINDSTFSNCSSLQHITIPDSVTIIRHNAFKKCTSLRNVTIPDSVTIIYDAAFENCTSLISITIPDSVTKIGDYAFSNCSSLQNIVIGNSVTTIKEYAFSDCSSLQNITIPDSVTTIERSAFYNCSSLQNITIPDSVTKIGDYAFSNCSSLQNIVIGNGVTTIERSAFSNCSSLQNITIPNSVITIKEVAFDYCESLKSIRINNPECEIYDTARTIYSGATIYGYKDSTAQTYAEKYGRTFVDVEHVHSYTSKVTSPTCTKQGYATYSCTCGDTYTESIEKLDHEYSDSFTIDTIATCAVVGSKSKHCTRSGCTAKTDVTVITKTAHTEVTVSGKAATCTEAGLTEGKKCSVCSTVTVAQQTIAAKGHNYNNATCTEAKKCKVCGATSGKANGHKYDNACDKSCNVCGVTRTIKHTYTKVTTKATLTKNGLIKNKCTICGYVASKSTTVYCPKTIKLSKTEYTYNGKVQTPSVTIKDSKGNTLKKDTDYTVKYESGRKLPGKYTVTITFKGKYSGTKKLTYTIAPRVTTKITATQTTTTITLKWNKVTGAEGYRIYQYNTKTKKYEKVKDVTGTSLKLSKLKSGTKYKFKVRVFTKDDGTIMGAYSPIFETATKAKTPTLKATSTKKRTASLSWTNVTGESGYQVYYATKKNGEYKKLNSYKVNVVKGSKSKLTSGKTYYFKVRAYTKTDSGTVYSTWSTVKSVKIK